VNFRPLVVSLNDVCSDQLTSLHEAVREARYAMEGRWIETMKTSKHCTDTREGLALLSRRDITWAQAWEAPPARTLLCIAVHLSQRVSVCGTHIAPREADKGVQINRVARLTQVHPQTPNGAHGDFNATPVLEVLDPIYAAPHG
jgi:hypothetical protein